MQSSKRALCPRQIFKAAMLAWLGAGVVAEAVVSVLLTSAKMTSIRRVALVFSASSPGVAVSTRHGAVARARARWVFPVLAQDQGRALPTR